jgi:hypothetical protein
MKKVHPTPSSGMSRFILMALAVMGLSFTAANAASPEVILAVGGKDKEYGNGKSLNVNSGSWVIAPSKQYEYNLKGSVVGTGALEQIVPPGTDLGTLLERIDLGSSNSLTAIKKNPTKKLPFTLFEKVVTGTRDYPQVGKVTFSLRIFAEIKASGQISCSIDQVLLETAAGLVDGTIKVEKGAKFTVTSAAEMQFKTNSQKVTERSEFAEVIVWRFGNTTKDASAKFKTLFGTATAPDDFTMTTGTVFFPKGKTEAVIKIPITKNPQKDPSRKFSVRLLEPGPGVAFGDRFKTTVGIAPDPN